MKSLIITMDKGAVLIVGDIRVGDIVLHHPLIRQLHKNGHEIIDILLTPYNADVAKLFPEIRNIHVFNHTHGKLDLINRIKFGISLRKYNYQFTFICKNRIKHALIPFFAKIPNRIGHKGESLLLTKIYPIDDDIHYALYFQKLALPINQQFNLLSPKLAIDKNLEAKTLSKFNLSEEQKLIAIGPGSTKQENILYPANNFAKIIDKLSNDSYKFILLGSVDDRKYAKIILENSNSNNVIDLTGKTNILELASILNNCFATISNDNGLMHISAGLNIPTLGLFVTAEPSRWRPLGKFAHYIKQKNEINISVDEIYSEIINLINNYESINSNFK